MKKAFAWMLVIACAISLYSCTSVFVDAFNRKKPAVVPDTKTATQIADEIKKEAVFQTVVLAANTVKKSMREPESLQWEDILANDDGTVICMAYRARNGFGGINKEVSVYVNGKPSHAASVWNKQCTKKSLNDMSAVKYALK